MTAWPWDRLAHSNAPSHAVLVGALQPRPGERWLDVGTGTGGTALRAARAGADVTGIDIAAAAIEQARAAAAEEGLGVRFDVADVQALPYEDASFDVVASAFGANFTPDHAVAARELARVCRPGGRLGLTLMPRDSRAGELWTLIRRVGGANGDHPADWAERVDDLLGAWFDIEWERRQSPPEADAPSPAAAWELARESFGPLRELVERLDEDAVAALKDEFVAIRERFEDVPPSYFLVLGRRR